MASTISVSQSNLLQYLFTGILSTMDNNSSRSYGILRFDVEVVLLCLPGECAVAD